MYFQLEFSWNSLHGITAPGRKFSTTTKPTWLQKKWNYTLYLTSTFMTRSATISKLYFAATDKQSKTGSLWVQKKINLKTLLTTPPSITFPFLSFTIFTCCAWNVSISTGPCSITFAKASYNSYKKSITSSVKLKENTLW